MKHHSKITILIVCTLFQYTIAVWNPFSGKDWKHLGDKIKHGFNKATDKIKDGFNKGIDKTKACSEVVALGSEWAAKQGAYQTAKAALNAAKTLQKTDPRLVGLLAAQKAADTALDAAQESLRIAQQASESIAKVTQLMGNIISKGFNIESITFATTSNQLLQKQSPPLHISGTIAGQHFNTVIEEADFSSSDAFINSILKNLSHKGSGI